MQTCSKRHFAIYGEELSVKGKFLREFFDGIYSPELKFFQGKRAAVFSEVVLEEYIEEDFRHGESILVQGEERSLRTFSTGEKSKALLKYLLEQNPDFLVLDNPFDGLDKESAVELKEKLTRIAGKIPVVQLFRRKEDLLLFIDSVLKVENDKIIAATTVSEFLADYKETISATKKIPEMPLSYPDLPEVMVKMAGVTVIYNGKQVLNNINWEIKKGEFWELTGPNGSGKSTLLSMIYGNNPKAYGVNLWIFGNKKGTGESVWEIKKKIGYFSPELTELFTRRNTVLEMLISGLVDSVGLYSKPTDKQLRLAKDWLKVIGFENKEKAIFTELSLLQQRMVLITRAMIKHPPLLILDEPTTALDDKNAGKIISFINFIAQESQSAVVYVSHRQEKGLKPQFIYRLFPSENGSTGEKIRNIVEKIE